MDGPGEHDVDEEGLFPLSALPAELESTGSVGAFTNFFFGESQHGLTNSGVSQLQFGGFGNGIGGSAVFAWGDGDEMGVQGLPSTSPAPNDTEITLTGFADSLRSNVLPPAARRMTAVKQAAIANEVASSPAPLLPSEALTAGVRSRLRARPKPKPEAAPVRTVASAASARGGRSSASRRKPLQQGAARSGGRGGSRGGGGSSTSKQGETRKRPRLYSRWSEEDIAKMLNALRQCEVDAYEADKRAKQAARRQARQRGIAGSNGDGGAKGDDAVAPPLEKPRRTAGDTLDAIHRALPHKDKRQIRDFYYRELRKVQRLLTASVQQPSNGVSKGGGSSGSSAAGSSASTQDTSGNASGTAASSSEQAPRVLITGGWKGTANLGPHCSAASEMDPDMARTAIISYHELQEKQQADLLSAVSSKSSRKNEKKRLKIAKDFKRELLRKSKAVRPPKFPGAVIGDHPSTPAKASNQAKAGKGTGANGRKRASGKRRPNASAATAAASGTDKPSDNSLPRSKRPRKSSGTTCSTSTSGGNTKSRRRRTLSSSVSAQQSSSPTAIPTSSSSVSARTPTKRRTYASSAVASANRRTEADGGSDTTLSKRRKAVSIAETDDKRDGVPRSTSTIPSPSAKPTRASSRRVPQQRFGGAADPSTNEAGTLLRRGKRTRSSVYAVNRSPRPTRRKALSSTVEVVEGIATSDTTLAAGARISDANSTSCGIDDGRECIIDGMSRSSTPSSDCNATVVATATEKSTTAIQSSALQPLRGTIGHDDDNALAAAVALAMQQSLAAHTGATPEVIAAAAAAAAGAIAAARATSHPGSTVSPDNEGNVVKCDGNSFKPKTDLAVNASTQPVRPGVSGSAISALTPNGGTNLGPVDQSDCDEKGGDGAKAAVGQLSKPVEKSVDGASDNTALQLEPGNEQCFGSAARLADSNVKPTDQSSQSETAFHEAAASDGKDSNVVDVSATNERGCDCTVSTREQATSRGRIEATLDEQVNSEKPTEKNFGKINYIVACSDIGVDSKVGGEVIKQSEGGSALGNGELRCSSAQDGNQRIARCSEATSKHAALSEELPNPAACSGEVEDGSTGNEVVECTVAEGHIEIVDAAAQCNKRRKDDETRFERAERRKREASLVAEMTAAVTRDREVQCKNKALDERHCEQIDAENIQAAVATSSVDPPRQNASYETGPTSMAERSANAVESAAMVSDKDVIQDKCKLFLLPYDRLTEALMDQGLNKRNKGAGVSKKRACVVELIVPVKKKLWRILQHLTSKWEPAMNEAASCNEPGLLSSYQGRGFVWKKAAGSNGDGLETTRLKLHGPSTIASSSNGANSACLDLDNVGAMRACELLERFKSAVYFTQEAPERTSEVTTDTKPAVQMRTLRLRYSWGSPGIVDLRQCKSDSSAVPSKRQSLGIRRFSNTGASLLAAHSVTGAANSAKYSAANEIHRKAPVSGTSPMPSSFFQFLSQGGNLRKGTASLITATQLCMLQTEVGLYPQFNTSASTVETSSARHGVPPTAATGTEPTFAATEIAQKNVSGVNTTFAADRMANTEQSKKTSAVQRKRNRTPFENNLPSYAKPSRCGVCQGCTQQNCGECSHCRDLIAFGGTGKRKKSCKMRKCLRAVSRQRRTGSRLKAGASLQSANASAAPTVTNSHSNTAVSTVCQVGEGAQENGESVTLPVACTGRQRCKCPVCTKARDEKKARTKAARLERRRAKRRSRRQETFTLENSAGGSRQLSASLRNANARDLLDDDLLMGATTMHEWSTLQHPRDTSSPSKFVQETSGVPAEDSLLSRKEYEVHQNTATYAAMQSENNGSVVLGSKSVRAGGKMKQSDRGLLHSSLSSSLNLDATMDVAAGCGSLTTLPLGDDTVDSFFHAYKAADACSTVQLSEELLNSKLENATRSTEAANSDDKDTSDSGKEKEKAIISKMACRDGRRRIIPELLRAVPSKMDSSTFVGRLKKKHEVLTQKQLVKRAEARLICGEVPEDWWHKETKD